MQDKPVLFLVGTRCAPELEQKLNNWYSKVHIPMLLKSRWLDGVTRYKLAPITRGEYPKYLAIYEFRNLEAFKAWSSSIEVSTANDELKRTWLNQDFEAKWTVIYEPMKSWHK